MSDEPHHPSAGPGTLRNVVLVGHSGAGKSTLAAALADGPAAGPQRLNRLAGLQVPPVVARSAELRVHSYVEAGTQVNLVDPADRPESADQVRAGLRAADAALFVVSAGDGVDAATHALWEECAEASLPRAVVVTQLDHPRAAFDSVLAICRRLFGEETLAVQLPMADDDGWPAGLLDLVRGRVIDYSAGTRTEREPDPEHLELTAESRDALVEAVLAESPDETLLDRYLDDHEIDEATLVAELGAAVRAAVLHPLVPVSAPDGLGVPELRALIRELFPAPAESPIPAAFTLDGEPTEPADCDPSGPLLAEVISPAGGTDGAAGAGAVVRVWSGTLGPTTSLHVARRGTAAEPESVEAGSPSGTCKAGDVCSVPGLSGVQVGDTLSDRAQPLIAEPWPAPDYPVED